MSPQEAIMAINPCINRSDALRLGTSYVALLDGIANTIEVLDLFNPFIETLLQRFHQSDTHIWCRWILWISARITNWLNELYGLASL